MSKLTAEQRHHMKYSEFALPGDRFPLNDQSHDRAAISGASRAYHAGNISKAQEETVDRKARAKLKHPRFK
ncbi:hypothetical protein [Dyella sp.]|jgi:hypothetical protein|uniref:hypothetical protein n=1 Tax=Dyella sp. TaxID=1869338 RepID=UPI002FD9FFDE